MKLRELVGTCLGVSSVTITRRRTFYADKDFADANNLSSLEDLPDMEVTTWRADEDGDIEIFE